ncbi:HDIG domain-containing protein [bacterium]|nr:HDIG domain-containing protein [bacterium]
MSDLYAPEATYALLHEFTQTDSLRRHAYAVQASMAAAAQRTGNDERYWSAVGLLHDFDYEMYPEPPDHPLKGAEILRARGYPDEFVRTILSHATYTGVPRENDCARWLFAVDELSGFCMACAMVQPDRRIAQVQVKSVRKKLKKKDFAAKVNRGEIAEGAADLGLDQDELIAHVLAALAPVADEIGL